MVVATARDVTASVRPPRAVFHDAPIGWTIGAPFQPSQQRRNLEFVMATWEAVETPGQIVDLPWQPDPTWKADYLINQS